MRWSGTAAVFGLACAVGSSAYAQSPSGELAATAPDDEAPPPRVGYGAMPGGLHTATAEVLPPGTVEIAATGGFGYRKGLVNDAHTFSRLAGDIAVAYAPVRHLMIGLSGDGRIDLHSKVADPQTMMPRDDNNAVGTPQLLVRVGTALGRVSVGGQLGIWLPGRSFPSLPLGATSVDALALLSVNAGFGQFTLDAGFSIDNSGETVDPDKNYSVGDQVSLGASKFNAALAGAALRVPAGQRGYVELEGSLHAFVGSGAPGPIVRGGAMAGIAVTDAVTLIGYVELAHVPEPTFDMTKSPSRILLVPYEPMVTGGVGLQARFGGKPRRPPPPPEGGTVGPAEGPREVIELAEVSGVVVDDAGNPVVGAAVAIRLKNTAGKTTTDEKGAYTIAKLPIGKTVGGKTDLDDTAAELSAEVANKKPGSATLTLARGANTAPRIVLDPMLPPGQLRAKIINIGTTRAVAGATVTIEPGGVTATSGPDGKLQVDLAPGHYKLTVTARGLAPQQLDVIIDPNGVAIKNIELHK
ncbi:MAG TPA: carboxypeptidase-like regulatory domain-containing protein [Kofleriaceae bacterium]|nr:carboxypeptidase-like regulatory domain-containing protein [Kofleriaceae bacterium]